MIVALYLADYQLIETYEDTICNVLLA